jgi:hypothetical protein
VANYLSTQTEFGGGREKFTRLQQIATILNLDPVSSACEPRVGTIHALSIIMCVGAFVVEYRMKTLRTFMGLQESLGG